MSGELIVKNKNGSKGALSFLVTAALVLVVMIPMARMMKNLLEKGTMTQIGFAILIPVLIVVLRPEMDKLLSGGKQQAAETLPWAIRNGVLFLGDKEIPLKTIKMVYCWQKGSAWTINIETTGRNQLLRSVSGPDEEESVQRLYDLVDALGYRSQWKET